MVPTNASNDALGRLNVEAVHELGSHQVSARQAVFVRLRALIASSPRTTEFKHVHVFGVKHLGAGQMSTRLISGMIPAQALVAYGCL